MLRLIQVFDEVVKCLIPQVYRGQKVMRRFSKVYYIRKGNADLGIFCQSFQPAGPVKRKKKAAVGRTIILRHYLNDLQSGHIKRNFERPHGRFKIQRAVQRKGDGAGLLCFRDESQWQKLRSAKRDKMAIIDQYFFHFMPSASDYPRGGNLVPFKTMSG